MAENNEDQPKQPEPTPAPMPQPERTREIPYVPIEDRTNLNEGLRERHTLDIRLPRDDS
jgi:hypothetical protein